MKEVFALLIRHSLTAAGLLGVVSDSNIEVVAGALAVVVGVAWSIWQKKSKKAI